MKSERKQLLAVAAASDAELMARVAAGEVAVSSNGVIPAPGTSLGIVHRIDADPVFLAPGKTSLIMHVSSQFGVEVLVEGAA